MSKIEILQVGPYPEWDQTPLDEEFTVHRYFEADDKPAFLNRVGGAVRGVACRGESIVNRQMIEAMPKLEVISVYGVGYDGVDLDTCRQRKIQVSNTPDVLTNDVADLAMGMMLALGRGIVPADNWVRSGAWKDKGPFPLMHRVHGRRAGVLGLGRIGQTVGRRLQARLEIEAITVGLRSERKRQAVPSVAHRHSEIDQRPARANVGAPLNAPGPGPSGDRGQKL